MNALVEQMLYKIMNKEMRTWPYPHFFVEDVFPQETYLRIQDWLDHTQAFKPLGSYAHRTFTDELPDFLKPLETGKFARGMLEYFGYQMASRFPNPGVTKPLFQAEWRFIRDEEGYSIGPHTDAPRKVMSLLFYLPKGYDDMDMGTGIYVPDDGKKKCPGGPHYPFDGFSEIFRAPFCPNSVFGFWKTDKSWHGVEKIPRKIRRDVLLFNIYEQKWEASPKIVVP